MLYNHPHIHKYNFAYTCCFTWMFWSVSESIMATITTTITCVILQACGGSHDSLVCWSTETACWLCSVTTLSSVCCCDHPVLLHGALLLRLSSIPWEVFHWVNCVPKEIKLHPFFIYSFNLCRVSIFISVYFWWNNFVKKISEVCINVFRNISDLPYTFL